MQRLRTRDQFQALLAHRPVSRTAHFALHLLPLSAAEATVSPDAGPLALFRPADHWLGAMVPKRWARRAVTRNAIRRQVYALGAGLRWPAAPTAQLVRLRAAFSPVQFPSACSPALKRAVRQELLSLFAQGAQR